MSALKFIQGFARKSLTKNQGSGIINLPGAMQSEAKAGEIVALLQRAGIPMNQLDDFIRSEADVAKFLNIIETANKPKVYSGQAAVDQLNKLFPKKGEVVDMTGKKIDTSQGIMGGKSVKELMESGQIQKGSEGLKKGQKITDRELFKNSNLNKQGFIKQGDEITSENFDTSQFAPGNYSKTTLVKDTVTDTITYIKTLDPIDAMKEANSVIGRKGKYKNLTPEESKKILTDTEDHIFERDIPIDPEDMAKGGRAGYYGGGPAMVGEDLSEIGHGSDSLMARNMQLSPNGQATTSTGLNYLLGQDNDTVRVPYAAGGGGRRAFLKLLGLAGAGVAGVKSGILGLSEGGAKKAVSETVKQAAGSGGQVPPYFLNLVKKIKNLGDDVTPSYAVKDRQKVTKYKEYELTEDVTTGKQEIQRYKVLDDDSASYYGQPLTEETYMSYTPGENIVGKGGKPVKTQPEYEEGTALLRSDRGNAGDIVDESATISDDVIKEGTVFEDTMSEFGKAEGGRIGFSAGGGKFLLSKLGINPTSRRFLEKVFGKEKFQTMIQNDPRMHRGMLEVVEMFRNKDKDGLKSYMKNFLPEMSDVEMEKFIVSSGDSAGIEGQLIRLGSGREYKNLINMKKEADQIRKLDDFDIEDVSKNAEGGRIGFSGGGILRAIIAKSAAKKGLSVRDFIKATNYKGLSPEVRMYISAEEFAALKGGQKELYDNFIDMAKTRKSFQEQVELGKGTPAKPLFDNLEQTMDEKSFVPKTVTSDDIAQMELMVKNRFNKGRKDNAQGGIQTMLGE